MNVKHSVSMKLFQKWWPLPHIPVTYFWYSPYWMSHQLELLSSHHHQQSFVPYLQNSLPLITGMWSLLASFTDDWSLDKTTWCSATLPKYSAAVESCSVDSPSSHPATSKDAIMIKETHTTISLHTFRVNVNHSASMSQFQSDGHCQTFRSLTFGTLHIGCLISWNSSQVNSSSRVLFHSCRPPSLYHRRVVTFGIFRRWLILGQDNLVLSHPSRILLYSGIVFCWFTIFTSCNIQRHHDKTKHIQRHYDRLSGWM